MIKDKNIFECIFLNDHIWFPNYVCWGPPSYGHQRRKWIFQQRFPKKESSISSKETWDNLRKKHPNKIRIFEYDEKLKQLNEIDKKDFFLNAYGLPIRVGQNVCINNVVYEIKTLEVIKWAGLIAGYEVENKIKKSNISHYDWNKEKQVWEGKE